MYFPRTHLKVTDTSSDSIINTASVGGSETIMVVDDELDIVELAFDLFTDHGYRVLTANDGQQAIEILKRESIDLVISDIIMPNVDGYQLAAHIIELRISRCSCAFCNRAC